MTNRVQRRATTVLSVRKGERVAVGGDGQVTLGEMIVKNKACKIRRLYKGQVLAAFAGATADAFTLLERFEAMLENYQGNVPKAATELAKEWRTDKALRRLESLLIVVDKKHSLLISGAGDVLEPDDGIIGVGSGGHLGVAAARALVKHTSLSPREIVEEALGIASCICIYSNENITVEEL